MSATLPTIGQQCRPVGFNEPLVLVRVSNGVATVRTQDGRTRQEPHAKLTTSAHKPAKPRANA